MALLAAHSVTHVSYILILFSAAFLMYLFVNILLHIYAQATWPDDDSNGLGRPPSNLNTLPLNDPRRHASLAAGPLQSYPHDGQTQTQHLSVNTRLNGTRGGEGWHSRKPSTASHLGGGGYYSDSPPDIGNGKANGAPRLPRHINSDSQQVRDAEEFELEGLMSDDGSEHDNPNYAKGKDNGTGNGNTGSDSSGSASGRKKEGVVFDV
jgi:hypothetical protein